MRRVVTVLSLAALSAGVPSLAGQQAAAAAVTARAIVDEPELVRDLPIDRELSGADAHSYRISLVSGQASFTLPLTEY